MNVNVTKIERLSNGIIQFYNGSEVVDSFSITSSVSVLFESNVAKSISFISNVKTFSFNVYNVLSVYGATSNKIYSSGIDPSDTSSAYISRLYDIYAFIISDVIQGCCPGPTFVGGFVATYPSFASFPATGQESVIYIDESTNEAYFWDGTTYQPLISISAAEQMATIGRNSTGSTLYKGTVIYISGSTGNRPNYVKAQANSEATSAGTFGVILADIPNNSDGYAVTIGTIDNLDTRSTAPNPFTSDTLVDGDTIYLSPTTAGYVTNVKPYAPDHLVYVGKVVRTSPTNGTIVYRIQNGYELDELHDVAAQTPSNNDGLFFESATSLWKNKSISTVLGYTPFNLPSLTSGSVLFSNGTTIAQDNAQFFWDDTNNRLGIGTITPSQALEVNGGTRTTTLTATTSVSTGTVNANILASNGGNISVIGSGTTGMVLFQSTRNLVIQNGGTFTDAGYRLDVNGGVRFGTNFIWDNTNGYLGIKRTPGVEIDVTGSIRASSTIFTDTGRLNFIQTNGQNLTVRGASSVSYMTMFQSTGNLLLQNGGTFTDAGYRLDVNGSVRTTGSISAASAIARGTFLNQTLVATANNDVLVGLDIASTFTLGAFTGVSRFPLRIRNAGNTASVFGISSDGVVRWGNSIESGNSTGQLSWDTDLVFINGALNLGFRTGGTDRMRIFNTGNVGIGTTTDAGFRLDVNGTARINVGATTPIIFGRNVTYPTVPSISMNNTLSDTLMAGFFADDLNFYINSPNRIIIRGSGNANNSSFVFSNGAMGQGYGAYGSNPSAVNGIFAAGKIGVGTNAPSASAKMQIDSTTEGFLPPRMTTTQKNAIASPVAGLVVYDTTLGKLCVRGASAWETITSV